MKKLLTMLFLFMINIVNYSLINAYNYGIKPSKNNERPDAGSYIKLIDNKNNYYIGEDEKVLYLTFDLGYELGYTSKILDTLKENDIKACFFITGYFLKNNPDLLIRMVNENHIVGNHSYNHPDMTKLSNEKIKEELEKVEKEYKNITNTNLSKFVRPPRGIFDENYLKYTNSLGYKNIFWSLAYVDWKTDDQRGKDYAFKSVTTRLHNGAIILLHTVSKDNMEALDDIIKYAKKEGYIFKSLDEL